MRNVKTSLHPALWILVLTAALLSSCKRSEPEIPDTVPCSETIKVTQRNGVAVVQTVSGLYIKAKMRGFGYDRSCGRTPETRHLIEGGSFWMYWANGQFEPEVGPGYTTEQWGKLTIGERAKAKEPWRKHGALIEMHIGFSEKSTLEKTQKNSDDLRLHKWWYEPVLPHKLYPLDLLPNWGLKDGPDPQAGIGQLKNSPPTWAVRGTLYKPTGRPELTRCSMNSPPGWDGKDHKPEVTKELDPVWLLQATTPTGEIGNTCRGYLGDDKTGYLIGAMIDVPGNAVPDIDKIYKTAAHLLSELIVE
jgi:hypothetical protein